MKVKLFFVLLVSILFAGLVSDADAYPNGPLWYVTDIGPFCAGCHSSTTVKQFPEQKPEFAKNWTIDGKHLVDFEKAEAYKDMSAGDKKKLIAAIKKVDKNASVKIKAPKTVKKGENMTVTVMSRGGSGPVIGLALVDNDIRFQARPISSLGFKIVKTPEIIGADGKVQTEWTDKRYGKLDKNINFAIVFDIKADIENSKYSESKVTWTLRAPVEPGEYTISAVFFYGTEKASPLGTVEQFGKKMPKGGFLGHSGRVMFSDVVTVKVK